MRARRGLRVRVGLHSGLSEEDVVEDKQTNAVKYVGRALSVAKVLCDCGHGGMVLLSEACYGALVPASGLAAFGHMLHLGDFQFLASAPDVPPTALYWCIGTGVQARLPLLLPRPLRRVLQVRRRQEEEYEEEKETKGNKKKTCLAECRRSRGRGKREGEDAGRAPARQRSLARARARAIVVLRRCKPARRRRPPATPPSCSSTWWAPRC